MLTRFLLVAIFIFILFGVKTAFATEPIMVTSTTTMNKIVWDGKWSSEIEWKVTSLNTITYNDSLIELRTAHQGNYLYVMIDEISNTNFQKGSDRATVCIDGKNDKSKITNSDDYCFIAILQGKTSFVLQGGGPLGLTKIQNPSDYIGIGGVSDENDRYSIIPHAGYEFKIPVSLFGRSDNYGFYLNVYDAHSNKIHSWPQDVVLDSPLTIPSPSLWGNMISPDKSLPEFPFPLVALLPAFFVVIFLTRSRLK